MSKLMRLEHDVTTLDGSKLLQAGTELNQDVMESVADRAKSQKWPEISLLEFENIRSDIRLLMTHGVYQRIFSEPAVNEALEKYMSSVYLPLPVLECMTFFREKDYYTYRHILMVFALSCYVVYGFQEEKEVLPIQAAAGPLHDIGKVCIPISTLIKSTPLMRSERRQVEHHAVSGYVLLTYYLKGKNRFSVRVARDHHERRDGSGYPRGISQEDFHVEIVSACDIYDALINPRPYRRGNFDNRTALEVLTLMAEEGKFSWEVVQRLVALNRAQRPHPDECVISLEKRGRPPSQNVYGVVAEEPDKP